METCSGYEKQYYLGPCLVLVNNSYGKTGDVPVFHKIINKGVERRMKWSVVGELCIKIAKKGL